MPRPLRIVSYNVRYFGHALRGLASTRGAKRGIANGLASLAPLPDIICLQEVETISLRSRAALQGRVAGRTQLEDFMAELEAAFVTLRLPFPYEAFYFRAHSYKLSEALPLYTTGLAVLVNLEVLSVEGHNAHSPEVITHHHVERWKDRKQSRICAHLRVTTKAGRPLHVFNTHLSLPTPFAAQFWVQKDKMGFGGNQLKEAQTLAQFVSQHAKDQPYIVCGDFNSPPGSPVFDFLTRDAGLRSAQLELGAIDGKSLREFPTAGFMRLRMHLDHLFGGNEIHWMDLADTHPFGVTQSRFHGLSDHVPLVARFRLHAGNA